METSSTQNQINNKKKIKKITITNELDKNNKEKNKYKIYIYSTTDKKEINNAKINYSLKLKNDEKKNILNVKYYIKTNNFLKRINEKPFYSYIEKSEFNKNDIIELLRREKLKFYSNTVKIKIKREKSKLKYFEKMKEGSNEPLDKLVTLEIYFDEIKENIQIINRLKNEVERLKEINEQNKKRNKIYDLIYLYASPIFKGDKNQPYYKKISYREEIEQILTIMKKKNKEFKCLFQCANENNLTKVFEFMETKILHISSHGGFDSTTWKYSLIAENAENCGKLQEIEENDLIKYIKSRMEEKRQIDLIILLTCYSEGFKNLIIKHWKNEYPNYIIYVKVPKDNPKKGEIDDTVCILFTKYFYNMLTNGNSISESFFKAKEEIKKDGNILSSYNSSYDELLQEVEKLQIIRPKQKRDISKDKNNEPKIYPFKNNTSGKISINKNVKANFHGKKYKSILGRVDIINKALQDLQENKCRFTVIYGQRDSGKLYFAESLCVFLFEREIINDYKIFFEFISENIIKDYINSKKIYNTKKIIVTIRIEEQEDLIKNIITKLVKYENFYFILIVDKENIEEKTKENIQNKMNIKCNFFDALLEINGAKELFKELCPKKKVDKEIAGEIITKNYPKKEGNEKYDPKIIEKLCDSYIANNFDKTKVKINENYDENLMNLSLDEPLFSYLFLLSKMPLGLPDCFVYLIFKTNFNNNLIRKNTLNKWNYVNHDIINQMNKNISNFETLKKNSIKYMLKALRLYCKILYFNIEKNRNKINYPDENIHFIFNSYNNEGIWKSNIQNIDDKKDIDENEFFKNDFNIQNHAENINNLINYFVKEIKYYEDQPKFIDYLLEILLLFPSFFFLKKICKHYIIKCKNFCQTCIDNFKVNIENFNNLFDKRNNPDIKTYPKIENQTRNNDLKTQIDNINKKRMNLEEQIQISKNNYEIWKELYIINSEEQKMKFINQKAKLSLFLYSISSEEINDFPRETNFQLELELKILKLIKNGINDDSTELETILKKNKDIPISEKRKALLYYELSRKYYTTNSYKSKSYFDLALKKSDKIKFQFLQNRINIDRCYIFLNKFKKKIKAINAQKEDNNDLFTEIKEKINILDSLKFDNLLKNNEKLNEEKILIREKLSKLIKPNTIMLNANPLNNGFSCLSSEIYAMLNNQYYILEQLMKQRNCKKIQSYIKIKSYILNEKNLEDSLKKTGEVLIIQSDDFTENGDIVLESDEGISQKLDSRKFLRIIKEEKKIKYKVVILSFFNCSKFVEFLEKNKVEYEYLIYFKPTDDFEKLNSNIKYFEFNRLCIEFIIYFISKYNKENDNIDDIAYIFNNKYFKNEIKCFYNCKKKDDLNLNNSTFNLFNKGIFFLDPLIDIELNNFPKNINNNCYAIEILEIIKEIKGIKGYTEIYSNKFKKKKYIEIGIEMIKYFYRHKTFLQYFIIDFALYFGEGGATTSETETLNDEKMESDIHGESLDVNEFDKESSENDLKLLEEKKRYKVEERENKYFYLIYNCMDKNKNLKKFLNDLKQNNFCYMVIYDGDDDEKCFNVHAISNNDDSTDDSNVDISEYTIFDYDLIF